MALSYGSIGVNPTIIESNNTYNFSLSVNALSALIMIVEYESSYTYPDYNIDSAGFEISLPVSGVPPYTIEDTGLGTVSYAVHAIQIPIGATQITIQTSANFNRAFVFTVEDESIPVSALLHYRIASAAHAYTASSVSMPADTVPLNSNQTYFGILPFTTGSGSLGLGYDETIGIDVTYSDTNGSGLSTPYQAFSASVGGTVPLAVGIIIAVSDEPMGSAGTIGKTDQVFGTAEVISINSGLMGSTVTYPSNVVLGDLLIFVGDTIVSGDAWPNWKSVDPNGAGSSFAALYSPTLQSIQAASDYVLITVRNTAYIVDSAENPLLAGAAPIITESTEDQLSGTVSYDAVVSVITGLNVANTRYLKWFIFEDTESLSSILSNLSNRNIIHSSTSGGRHFVVLLDNETVEIQHESNSFGGFNIVASEIQGDYFGPTTNPPQAYVAALFPASVQNVGIVEDDDILISLLQSNTELSDAFDHNIFDINVFSAPLSGIITTELSFDVTEDSDTVVVSSIVFERPTTGISEAFIIAWSADPTNIIALPPVPQNAAGYEHGDKIIIYAYRDGSNTPPSSLAGFTDVNSQTGGSTNSARVMIKDYDLGDELNTWEIATSTSYILAVVRNFRAVGENFQFNGSGTTALVSQFSSSEPLYSKTLVFVGTRNPSFTFQDTVNLSSGATISKVTQSADATDSVALYEYQFGESGGGGGPDVGSSTGYNTTILEIISSYAKAGIVYVNEDNDSVAAGDFESITSINASITEANDTSTSTATKTTRSVLAVTEANDSSVSSATTTIGGYLIVNEDDDTIESSLLAGTISAYASINEDTTLFTPNDLQNLHVWIDPYTGLVNKSAGSLSATDVVANSNTFYFNGSSSRINFSPLVSGQKLSFFAVVDGDPTKTQQSLLGGEVNSLSPIATNVSGAEVFRNTSTPVVSVDGTVTTWPNRTDAFAAITSGEKVITMTNHALTNTWSAIGYGWFGFYFKGHMRDVIIVSDDVTTEVRQKIEGYLAHKWSLTGNLPIDHPYKNAPPKKQSWSPLDVSSLTGWFDASDISTLQITGSKVSSWADKSPTAVALVQATDSLRPTYDATTFNGLPGVEFSNSTLVGNPIVDNSAEMGLFFVYREDQRINNTGSFFSMNDSVRISSHMPWGDGNFYIDTGGPLPPERYSGPYGVPVGTPRLIYVRYSVLNSIRATHFDGEISPAASIASGSSIAATNMRLGAMLNNISPGHFTLCEMIATDSDVTLSERQQIEGYLAHKWGISSSLPTDHPYKTYSLASNDSVSSISVKTTRANSSMSEGADTSTSTGIKTTRANSSITELGDNVVSTIELSFGVNVTEEDDALSSAVVGPYQRVVPGQIVVDPTSDVSLINAAVKQPGDRVIVTLSGDDLTSPGSTLGTIGYWNTIASNYRNDIVTAGLEDISNGGVSGGSTPNLFTAQTTVYEYNSSNLSYEIPVANSILNPVYVLVRNYYVRVGSRFPSGGGISGYDYIPILNPTWDGIFVGQRFHVALNSNTMGAMFYYYFAIVRFALDGTPPYNMDYPEIEDFDIHYTGTSPNNVVSAKSKTITDQLFYENWYPASGFAEGAYTRDSLNIKDSAGIPRNTPIGVFVYLQEEELYKVSFVQITEDDDTLVFSNTNLAYNNIYEEDDSFTSTSLLNVRGVDQTEQDDIVDSFGYHFYAPQPLSSIEFLGYTETTSGNAITFPAGIQDGDVVFAVGGNLADFDSGWTNWTSLSSNLAIGKYSSTLNIPVVTSTTAIYAFSGVDFVDSFPFGAPLESSQTEISGNEIVYQPYASVGVNNLLELTQYFKVFVLNNGVGLTSNLLSDLSSRVVHSFSSFTTDTDYVIVIDGETNEPTQILATDSPFGMDIVVTDTSTEILSNNYGFGLVTGQGIMLLPISIEFPAGISRVEYLEEDDASIRGEPIRAVMLEADDTSETFAYKYEPAPLIGAEFVETYYVPYTNMSSITLDVNDLVVLIFDVTATAYESGGASNNLGVIPARWGNFPTNNITYAHGNIFESPGVWTNDLGDVINGAWVVRYSNVGDNKNTLYIDPSSAVGTFLAGDSIRIYTPDESYPVEGSIEERVLNRESKAIRIALVDFVNASALGATPSGMHSVLPESTSLLNGSLTSITDAYFAVDEVPTFIDNDEGEVVRVVTDGDIVSYSPASGGENYEYLTLLFPPASLYTYGKNPNLSIIEEDDQLIRGEPLYLRLTEDDDIVESFIYPYQSIAKSSLEFVSFNEVGVTTSFTLSPVDYNVGDFIIIQFTTDQATSTLIIDALNDLVANYPELTPNSRTPQLTDYILPIQYSVFFDGVEKTYNLLSPLHVTLVSYRGVLKLAVDEDNTVYPNDMASSFANGRRNQTNFYYGWYIDSGEGYTTDVRNKIIEYVPYYSIINFGTLWENSPTSSFPASLFNLYGVTEKYYNVTSDGTSTFTTYFNEIVNDGVNPDFGYDFYGNGNDINFYWPWTSSGFVSLPTIAETLTVSTIILVPETVTYSNNRAEIFEEDDSIEAVLEKSGVNSIVNVTEDEDTISFVSKLNLVASVAVTEANDSVAATSSAPVKANFSTNEQDDFIASTSSTPVKAAASITESSDTAPSVSNLSVRANASITEVGDLSSSASTISIKAAASITEAGDVIASASSVLVKADSSNAESNDAISSTGIVPARANATLTENDDTWYVTSVISVRANVNVTEENDAFESVTSGKTPLYAVIIEADDVGSSTAKISIKAATSITEADDTPSGTSKIPVVATLISVEDADAILSTANPIIKGSASITEANDSVAATSTILVRATTNVVESDDVSASVTRIRIDANSNNQESDDSVNSSSGVLVAAISTNNEENDSVVSLATILISASSTNTEANDSASSTGVLPLKSTVSTSEGDDSVASTSKVAILSAVVANEQDDYLNSIVLRTIEGFTGFALTSDFAAIANRIRYSTASFESAAELYGLGLKTITIAVEMTGDSDFETIQTRVRQSFAQFNAEFDFNTISIPVPGTTYRIVYVIAEINRVNVDAHMNTEDVMGLANEEIILVTTNIENIVGLKNEEFISVEKV